MNCSDCPQEARPISEATRLRGGKVREPGEVLCAGCSARRVLMVRAVDALPASLDLIKAQRLSTGTR